MRIPYDLKQAALSAFDDGQSWSEFIDKHHDAIRDAAGYDRNRYHRLRSFLMSLLVSGDCDGVYAVSDPDGRMGWELDDDTPHDTITAARFDPVAAGGEASMKLEGK